MNTVKKMDDKDIQAVQSPIESNTVDSKQSYALIPLFLTGLLTMFFTLCLCIAGFQYWQNNYQLRIITVRMSDVLSDHILEIGSSGLSEQQKEQYALRWSLALDDTIKELTEDNRTIVLTQNTSIAGVEDFTELVEIKAKDKVGGINEFGSKAQTQ